VNFLMVEIPSPKPYILMIRVNRQMKCPKSWGLRSSPSPTEHSIAYRCFPQASTLTFFLTCPFGQVTKMSCTSKSFGLVLYSAIKKTSGRGWGWPQASTLGAFHLSIHPDHQYIWLRW
jgi:hypothetical protein